MRVYIAGPLFNEIELERNRKLREEIKSLGFDTYLPQEDGGISYELIKKESDIAMTRQRIFETDFSEIQKCNVMLCILDGRVPDEGMCIELGAAYALGKKCLGYKTDKRSLDQYGVNLMIEGCLSKVAHTTEELRTMFQNEF